MRIMSTIGIGIMSAAMLSTSVPAQQAGASTAEQVGKVLTERLRAKPEKVTATATLRGDLGADELDLVELVIMFEEKFSCQIPDTAASGMQTVGDAIHVVEECAKSPRKAQP